MSAATPTRQMKPRDVLRRTMGRLDDHQSLKIVLGSLGVMVLLPTVGWFLGVVAPGFGTQRDWVGGFADAGVFVLLAVGLNVVVGLAGLLDLGYAAFFAIGAYTYAYGASSFTGLHTPFWIMLFIGAAVAATFGLLLGAPTLRLRGDYLAIVTLGFGEIVPVVILNSDQWTRGTNGITGLDQPDLYGLLGINGFGFQSPFLYFFTVIALITFAFIFLYRLQDSRLGRAWVAIREDELAAASMGINTVTTKLLAFAIGATTSGLAGAFYGAKLGIVSPDQFHFDVSFTVLAMVVLGGMGNIWGVAIGAFVIYEIQHQGLHQLGEFMAALNIPVVSSINFINFQGLLYGLALVAMMLFRPEGLFPSRRRRLELHAETDEAAELISAETLEPT
jgi:ABC-type branched-subunit amino acid transport system permease subunit